MNALENIKGKFKEFKPTSWAIDNKTSVYLMILFVTILGVYKFTSTPKEQFPDIVIPQIYVQTTYVGNSPKDIENLVTRPLEKQIKGITGAKIEKLTSTSVQDFSAIIIEFESDVKTDVALQKVKDAVDKAKTDLPTDLTTQPNVVEISLSDLPIIGPFEEVVLFQLTAEWELSPFCRHRFRFIDQLLLLFEQGVPGVAILPALVRIE